MMKYCHLLILFLLLSVFKSIAQTDENDSLVYYQRIDASFVFGGQIYNNNLIYNPGYGFQTAFGMKLNESVGLGIGTGFYGLESENFLPLFIEAIGFKKKMPSSPFIKMQAGYAFGWYSGNVQIDDIHFYGGVYIDAGLGRKISINCKNSILFQCSYRHQFGRMEYRVFERNYSEATNYDMIVISLGVIRNN